MAVRAGTHKHKHNTTELRSLSLSRAWRLWAWTCSYQWLMSALPDYAGVHGSKLCFSKDEIQFSRYQEVREGRKRGKWKWWRGVKRFRGRGGGRRNRELRQSPSEACAFWPVEAVNMQGSLGFCARAARLIGKTVDHTGCCFLSMVNRQGAQMSARWILS